MAKISMSDISPELTPEELQELEAAEKMPVIFDEDCPEMTEKMLQQFHRMDSVVAVSYTHLTLPTILLV